MEITFGNTISVEEYQAFRKAVNWKPIADSLAVNTIQNALYLVTAIVEGKKIGITRVGGDGGYTIFITDVMILPEYQKKGIGKLLMTKAVDWVKEVYTKKNGLPVLIYLMANKGLENYYKQFGFIERPNETLGAGMIQWIEK